MTTLLATTLAACGSVSEHTTTRPPANVSSASAVGVAQSESDAQNALAAIASAEKATGGIAISIDDKDNDTNWEVDVVSQDQRWELTISADGTTVTKKEPEDDDQNEAEKWSSVSGAKIKIADAIKAALANTPGRFDDAEFHDHDGSWHWEVSIHPQGATDSTDLAVDPTTGKVSKD